MRVQPTAGQPVLFTAHAEPERQPQRQQGDAQLKETLTPTLLGWADAAFAQQIEY